MSFFTRNNENILLNEALIEIEQIKASPEFVIYHQCLNQLHLPTQKWVYSSQKKGWLEIVRLYELLELDKVFFKSLEYSKLINPIQLYSYYLLQQFLGKLDRYQGIGLLSKSKGDFVFLNTGSSFEISAASKFERNDLSRWILRRGKSSELKVAHDSFFILLDQKFKEKLLISLTLYQSETSESIDKTKLIDSVLDTERLERLRLFSMKEIGLI
ncbi:hypothetical protein N8987_06365 [Crocinitomix sp.]|nr:hypothetical protein [Crocinitomix sp.]